MKITIWNAFASNNSGSYTIVGRFGSPERAAAVAATLRTVCAEHSEWHRTARSERPAASPVVRWIAEEGLQPGDNPGGLDEWPEYDADPAVEEIDRQVVLHVPCTISMPPCFGEFFYRQGGRVQIELDHAHHPIAARLQIWRKGFHGDPTWPARRAAATEILRRLTVPARSFTVDEGEWGALELRAVFDDLIEGVAAVRDVVAREGLECSIVLVETEGSGDDTAR
ncbi:MAG: hypothetical protein H6836_09585 [Planctomycetes bacterium]|nr:hypothetical protein [Planctomycetota bacterium]MCB9889815.1 hypothetical protein [Planctomycetota bacterium]